MLRVSQQNQSSKLGWKGGTDITYLLHQLAHPLLKPSDPENSSKARKMPKHPLWLPVTPG